MSGRHCCGKCLAVASIRSGKGPYAYTTDSVVWGGLSGATPAEAVSWGKVNPDVLPDTVMAYCDSTIAFPLFCEYAVGSPNGRRPRKELVHKRDALVAALTKQALAARDARK